VLYAVVGPALAGWPLPLRLGVLVPVVAASMTWLAMPRLTRIFAWWLYPTPDAERRGRGE
jgi:uncharacterized protein